MDSDAIRAAAAGSSRLLTVEEHNVIGGLGGAVAEVLADAGAATPLVRHGIADTYSLVGPPTHLYRHYRLDADGIADRARRSMS
jgi:transketolase